MNNFNENDGPMLSKRSSIQTIDNNNSQLRINIKERKPRATIPLQIPHSQRPSLQHAYSFMDQNHPTQVRHKNEIKVDLFVYIGWISMVSSK
jgi:hypothetical protein